MKRNFTLINLLCFLFLSPCCLFAQDKHDYLILLKSGNFTPPANTKDLKTADAVLHSGLFNNKYYVTIQFNSLPDQATKSDLGKAGIKLIDYIPNLAYTASVDKDFQVEQFAHFDIRSIFQFTSIQKSTPAVLNGPVPNHAIKKTGYADINVLTYEQMKIGDVSKAFTSAGAEIMTSSPFFRMFTVRIPAQDIHSLASLSFVQWIEFIDPPNQMENLPGRTLHRVNILNDGVRNLKGNGVNVGIWDGGAISPHVDFYPTGRVVQVEAGAFDSHSTHCSGTICGRGLINPTGRGMAPEAKLYSYDYNGDVQAEMATAIPLNNLLVSSHSYNDGAGVECGLTGTNSAYTLRSRNTDINLNNNISHLHVHSAGNSQGSCANGWTTITGTGKSAKNNLVVAAISTTETMTTFSSFGPVGDGRIKPEISAIGLNVFSTYLPLNTYGTISGTSMSTPGAAGTVALLFQAYKQLNGGSLPPSSLIKNIVCNTGKDLGNPGPDYKFGFGCINALQAVKILEENRYRVSTIATSQIQNSTIVVPAGASRLRVMLTWNDPAGTANANPALVNDLDLAVINGATTLPWKLDPNSPGNNATRGIDNISNIEQVTMDNPPAGTYTIRVAGTSIPVGPQEYSLTWSVDQPYIEVLYPNGNESLNPGSSEMITWDNSGISSTQTVDYSLDNGTTWTTISNAVAATVNRLAWTVPSANTSTALIRITSGPISDISDISFKILGTTTGFATTTGTSCNSGTISFLWNAGTNTTHHDIYMLDNVLGNFVILAANLTGTSYTATGLTPGANTWFTIVAKNNTTNATSERAIAINATVSSGGGGLGVIGTIVGQTAFCGVASNIPYNITPVSGATGYTWTVPTGVTIISGQGTNSITVNYLAGAMNGNVAVFATNGICQTNISTLAITVNSTSIPPPVTGGDQSQTVCPGFGITPLTAVASVPAGYTVVWYNAMSGGSVVASPTLSAPGTVTYYAASKNTTSGCEGSSRTAVVLTITLVAQPTVTAGGSTTFCQGASVVLTANAATGSSYGWVKDGIPIIGANSQSYIASASGTYLVKVSTGTCITTSAPVNVTVNSLPVASISTGGTTDICQGDAVLLTASAGASWLWSNGATTQSQSVTTAGNYSVTVTNTSTCSSVSPVVSVTVSPKPIVTITASPYMNLFPGLTTTLTATANPPGSYNYVWFRNGIIVPGANSAVLNNIGLDDLGNYTVSIANIGGIPCLNTSAELKIADSASKNMFIYPSPTTGQFRVSYYSPASNAQHTLKIYDAKGAYVYGRNYVIVSPYQTMEVDMRRNSKGVYRVVLFDNNGKKLAVGSVMLQ